MIKIKPHWLRKIIERVIYGRSCCDFCDLDYCWAKQMKQDIELWLPRAEQLTDLDWLPEGETTTFRQDIKTILETFDMMINEDYAWTGKETGAEIVKKHKEYDEKVQKGLDLFARKFRYFWY